MDLLGVKLHSASAGQIGDAEYQIQSTFSSKIFVTGQRLLHEPKIYYSAFVEEICDVVLLFVLLTKS
jgi:hypothetical protein